VTSIYVSHRGNQLPTTLQAEGLIYPLLRRVDDTHLTWAFAVPQPTETDSLEKRRKNRLICAVLQAFGFILDEKNATSGKLFDFYHLANDSLMDPFATSVFDIDTLPDELSGNPVDLKVLDPKGGTLKLSAVAPANIKANAPFKVQQFVFTNNPGSFDLGPSGQPTVPGFTANVTLKPELKSEFPSGTLPVLKFDQSGVSGGLRCNTFEVISSNKMPGSTTTIAADIRHDRLTLDVATLVCTEPDTSRKLAIEVFPAISFQPDANLPVTVSISNDGVCMRLQPRIDSGDMLEPRLTINRFKPCVRFTVRGPVIHADASSSGALEALRLLEPAERKFEDTVEQINDFLVYSFEVCLPTQKVQNIDLPDLLALEMIGFDLPNWPDSFPRLDKVIVPEFLSRLAMPSLGLRVPDYLVNPLEIDLRSFGLPFPDLRSSLGLPDDILAPNWPLWSEVLRFHKIDGVLLDKINITGMSLDGLMLKVTFAEIPDVAKLELHLPDKIKWDQFDVQFPEVGIPSLTEFELGLQTPDAGFHLKVAIPNGPIALAQPELWSIQLKKPSGPKLSLKITEVKITGFVVQFKIANLPAIDLNVDKLLVKWSYRCIVPDFSKPEITLSPALPPLRLPKIDGDIDFRMLKLRAFKAGIEFGMFGIIALDFKLEKVTLDIPPINGKYPILDLFFDADVTFDVSFDVSLSLSKCSLSDLLGDLGSVDFRFSVPQLAKLPDFDVKPVDFDLSTLPLRFSIPEILASFGSLATPIIPLELVVRVPHPTKLKLEWDELKLVLGMKFDLGKLRLAENRIYFFLPQRRSSDPLSNFAPRQVMDFNIFTLTFPNRPEPLGIPTLANHDGYLDLTSREFVIDLKYKEGEEPTPPPRIHAFFPGGMDPKAARCGREGVENLGKTHADYSKFRKEYSKRFDLELDEVDPKLWPNTGPDRLMFRFNSNGLTFAANLGKTEVEIDSSGFSDDGGSDGKSSGLIKPFKCQPQEKQRELRSRVVIIDNELKEAGVYAKTEVPGVENLMAEVSVVLRQRQKGMLPEVHASMELERADEAPLAEFSIKLLELSLDRLELGLIWRMQEREWDYSIIADGTIGFTGAAALVPDLDALRVPSIQVVGLDMRRMNLRQLRVPINLVKPVRFDILDGMFEVELGDLEIGWEFDGKIPKPRLLACELAKLTFKNPGALEVSVSVGGLQIEFDEKLKAHVTLPSSLGIEVALGTSANFAGRVGWIDERSGRVATQYERYLFAEGKLLLEGLPEVRALLKFGTGEKLSGRREINLVLYGEMDLDEQLFSGAVVKSLGLGVGLNNRLAAIPASPSADAILRRIDLITPGKVEGWQFVREGGFYMSVIGSVTLASNLGEPDVLNAYVAALVVSIDTNFDLVAAGKLWLSCSVKGQKDNPNNPAFVGALVLSPRQRKLEVVLESRKNAYVEQNDLIKKLLDKGFVRFAFRMTPQLVDFHLAEVSYREQMFGVQMEFNGEYRFAIFKRAVLLKNELSATGSISKSLSGGAGGFDLDGQAYLRVGYGGLLSDRGAMAYAFIEAGIRFRVSAWIEIGFSISIKICGKRYSKSWSIVFRTRVPQLELTLRGHIAIADRGGFGGFELLVGINVPICGYWLNVTAGWAMNVELYQEVRSTVSAFEAELEAAVKALDKSEERASFAPAITLIDKELKLITVGANAPAPPPDESWLLYTRDIEDKSTALLLPAPDGRWLTPAMATITSIDVKTGLISTKDTIYAGELRNVSATNLDASSTQGEGAKFDVIINASGEVTIRIAKSGRNYSVDDELKIVGTSLKGGATPDDDIKFIVKATGLDVEFSIPPNTGSFYPPERIRLVGLRGKPDLNVLNNASWPIKASDDTSITLDIQSVSSIQAGSYSELHGGIWYIEETVTGLSSQDHDTVPYLNEVERAVVRTSPWFEISEDANGSILNVPSHGIEGTVRVMLREGDDKKPIVDRGKKRLYDDGDSSCVTFIATKKLQNTLELAELGNVAPKKGWQLATAIEIAPPWSARNRLAAIREYTRDENNGIDEEKRAGFNQNSYRDYTGAAAAWAETSSAASAGDGEAASTSRSYAVVFDERYASADSRFSPADAPVEPGVLSARFRPIDDVEAVGVDSVLEAARRFEEASRSVARQQLHGAFDLDENQAIQQSRAQATQLLVHRLSDPRGPDFDNRPEAPLVKFKEDEPHKIQYGWLCEANKSIWSNAKRAIGDGKNDVLFVRRAGRSANAVAVKLPDNTGLNDNNKPTPLPIRQDFVIDDTSAVNERGRVIVRLPIRYPNEILRRRPEEIGRLQVYRRIGLDGPEELVFDELRPDISQLDKKQVYSKSRQQFVDYLPSADASEDFRMTGTFDPRTRKLTIDRNLAALLPQQGELDSEDPLKDLKCSVAAVGYIIESVDRDEQSIDRDEHSLQLTLARSSGLPSGQTDFSLHADGLIVPRPVLISDEFAIVDRQFSPELRALLSSGRRAQIYYSLVAISEDETGGVKSATRIPWPEPVPLYIPKRKEPLPSLALAIPVGSLVQSSRDGATVNFQLVDLGEETAKLAERNGLPLSADDFEFWLDGDILRQSGFYAGEAADPNPPREGDGERVTLAAVTSTDAFESTAGKIRIGVKELAGYWQMTQAIPSGTAFRAFFRREGDSSVRSLRRLPILLVREFPKSWDSTVRYRLIDTAEVIPVSHKASVEKGEAIPLLVDFSADDRYEAGRAAIRSVWPSLTLLEGGVELQFRDFDDSSMRSRTLVEVLEADEFSRSQNDFRDDTFWTPRPPDRVERYVSRAVAKAEAPPDEAKLRAVYLWQRLENQIDVVRRLEKAKGELVAGKDWELFANAVRNVQTALLSFEKSPLNLNRLATRQLVEMLRLALRAVIVGNNVGADHVDKIDDARTTNQSLLELLTRIEQSRAETVSDTDANDVAFLDRDTARKLAGIARRRIAIADEALALQKIEEIPQSASMRKADNPNALARLKKWDELLKDARSLADKPLPMTESLISQFLPQPTEKEMHRNAVAVSLCKKLIDLLVIDIGKLGLETLVPRAAGLSKLLHRLNEKIRGTETNTSAGLLKRPHHELTTTRREDGEIVAREVPLRTLLPARARQAKVGEVPQVPDERLERLGIRAGHVATLFANGNVAIWTTRCNSVHKEPMERVQHFSTRVTTLSNVSAFELSEVAEGPRLLIAATFDTTADVQLWDAGKAQRLRNYGSSAGAAFASTPRGLEVAFVFGHKVLLETTEKIDLSKQVKFSLTQEAMDRLSKLYAVPDRIIGPIGTLKGQEFENELAFRKRLAELEGQDELQPYLQVVINQALNPISVRPPLAFEDGGVEGDFAGPVAYHDEIHVVAAASGNEILFWRDMGRPENKTPFCRLPLTFDIRLVNWDRWASNPTSNKQGLFIASIDPSDFLHIRRFDASGVLIDTFETMVDGVVHLRSQDSNGNVLTSVPVSGLPESQKNAVTSLNGNIKQLLSRNVLREDDKRLLHKQAAMVTGLVPPSVTHIQPVTLPAGAGFVIATKDYPNPLLFFSPVQRRPEPVAVRTTAATVTQLVVDRRESRVSAIIDDKVHTYDLLELKPWKATPAAKHVAILHGRHDQEDESYLAYSADKKVDVSSLYSLKDDPEATNVELRQTLDGPKVLGEPSVDSNIVAITSALQTARTATAAGDPLSLFHLWERMGFAIDIAAQNNTSRLLGIEDLRKIVGEVVKNMGSEIKINEERHYVYMIEGEEPDAEFRDDRVGFSHVNVAVVPEAFLAACLQPNFDALKEWLTNRSIKLAHEILTTDSKEERAKKEQENHRELEYIVHMTQLVGVPEPSRFGTVEVSEAAPPTVPSGGTLRLQPRSDRFVRVPASAGFSHWSWTLPDRKGHRMLVAARRVSRYEPLLRWWLNLHTRFDLPEEVALGGDLRISKVVNELVSVDQAIPVESGWQPLRLEIVKGDGAGQRRELLPFEPSADRNLLYIDSGDPWLEPKPRPGSLCRVMDAAPGWRLVVIDAIHDPARGEGARSLMVYQYPHSRKPRFSYQIPLDGMRATYNQISRVRTGYDGIEAAFRYFLPDRIDNPDAATLLDLLNAIIPSADGPTLPPRTVTNVAGGAEPNVRLFRHERMVSLPGLPFFYRYRLDVRSAYKARTLEYDRSTAAERLPDDEIASPPAQRLPASLGLNEMTLSPMVLNGKLPADQPSKKTMVRLFSDGNFEGELQLRVRPESGDDWIEKTVTDWEDGILTVDSEFAEQPKGSWEYELNAKNAFEAVLYLSANRDHLTREEANSEPKPVEVLGMDARHLPDFFMDYHLYRNQFEGDGSLPSIGDVFSVIGSIRMPWSPNFRSPAEAKMKPFVSVASGVKLVNLVDDGSPTLIGQEGSFAIERVIIDEIGESPYWRLRFWIANDPGQEILAREKVYIQAIRDGKLTRAVKCAMPE